MKHKTILVVNLIVLSILFSLGKTSTSVIAQEGGPEKDTRNGIMSLGYSDRIKEHDASDEVFVSDDNRTGNEDLDQYLFIDSDDGSIDFIIDIDRFYFNEADPNLSFTNGFLDNADDYVDKHILPEYATLYLAVYDVDADASGCPEVDLIYVNGRQVKKGGVPEKLSGANNEWSTPGFKIPIGDLKLPQHKGNGSGPTPVANEIEIKIDVGVGSGSCYAWAVEADWGSIEIESPIRPILFVHGWKGTTESFSEFEEWMKRDGIPSAGQVDLNRGIYSIDQTAVWLKDGIELAATEYGVDKLNIFAHSKGGLVAREALRDISVLKLTDQFGTFATPHHGTKQAESWAKLDVACDAAFFLRPNYWDNYSKCMSSGKELRRDRIRDEFNYAGCVEGDWENTCTPQFPLQSLPYFSFAANGDEAVKPLESTTFPWVAYLDGGIPFPETINVDQVFDVPNSFAWGGDDHSGLIRQEVTYKCAISYLDASIFSRSNCPVNSLSVQSESGVEALSENDFQIVLDDGGTLAAGNSQVFSSAIDGGSKAIFYVYSDQPLIYTLTSPSSQIINPALASTDPNITYTSNTDGTVKLYQYEITSPLVGTWKNMIQAGGNEVNFAVSNETNSTVQLSYKTNKFTYQPGDLVTLETALEDDSIPYTGVNFAGTVTHPDDSTSTLTFYDDGTHGDVSPGNGVYTAQFTTLATNGHAQIALSAEKGNITRVVETSIAVASQTAAFQYIANETPVDTNWNGLYDRLDIGVTINVIESGEFEISGRLVDGAGNTVATGYYSTLMAGTGPFSTGLRTVTLSFDGNQIYEHGANGPYTLKSLIIHDVTESSLEVDTNSNVHTTAAYQAAQFERPMIAMGASSGEVTVDFDSNGRYDLLQLSLGVDVVQSGTYNLNGRLVDANGSEIAWSSTSFYASGSGSYTAYIGFDGYDIAAHHVDGPYTLKDLSISGTSNSKIIGEAYTTQAYSVIKFEGDTSFADVSASHWASPYIEVFYSKGITTGCSTSPLSYCPENRVTRAEMAVFLERAIRGGSYTPPVVSLTFSDTSSHWAKYWIERLRLDGITTGCGLNVYCPDNYVTRAEMAVFIERVLQGSSYTPPVVSLTFTDTPGHWARYWIEQFKSDGITTGCGPTTYCPNNYVTRAEMAVFLTRAFDYTSP